MRGAGRLEDPGALRRPRRHQRRPGLRRHPPRRRQRTNHSAIDFWISPRGIQADSVFNEGPFTEDFGAGLLLAVRRQDRHGLLDRRGRDPAVVAALPEEGPAGLGADAVPRLAARVQLPVLQRPDAARLELLSLPVGDGRGDRRPAAGRRTACSRPTAPVSEHEVLRRAGRALATTTRRPRARSAWTLKWLPDADTIVDATINPDFSQVEADVGADLRQRAVRALLPGEAAVLPRARGPAADADPGDLHAHDHLAALGRAGHRKPRGHEPTPRSSTDDRGGGTVIIPGPVFSDAAPQDYQVDGRIGASARTSATRSSASSATARVIEGGGYNYVVGGDFQWRPNDADLVNGQYLYSFSQNPGPAGPLSRLERPEASRASAGRRAGATRRYHWDWNLAVRRLRDRASAPTTGSCRRSATARGPGGAGYRFFPTGFFSRLRLLDGRQLRDRPRRRPDLAQGYFPGISFQAQWEPARRDRLQLRGRPRSTGRRSSSTGFVWTLQASPSRLPPASSAFAGNYGEQPDVANVRVGTGGDVLADGARSARPTTSGSTSSSSAVDRRDAWTGARDGSSPPTSRAPKAIYVFNSRMLLPRLIGQYIETYARSLALDRSRSCAKESEFSRARPSSPTSSTGRACSSSATATTAPSTRQRTLLLRAEPAVLHQSLLRVPALAPSPEARTPEPSPARSTRRPGRRPSAAGHGTFGRAGSFLAE